MIDEHMKDEIIDVLFLDYDGVLNTEPHNFDLFCENDEAAYFISKLCLDNKLKIVVSSSWRNHPQYRDIFYNSGLDEDVEIIGTTDPSTKGRRYEIEDFLKKHPNVRYYIILDDAHFSGEIGKHLVQTAFRKGFTENKYKEAVRKLNYFKELDEQKEEKN